MALEGIVDAAGLAELLKNLGAQQATGVLSFSSPMGEKQFAFLSGEVVVFSDPLAQPVRLGEFLVAQGRLSRGELEKALQIQKKAEGRPRLGDVLVEQGFVKQDDINAAVRFKVEEEIADVFTWREVRFRFEPGTEPEELEAASQRAQEAGRLHRIGVDARSLIEAAATRMDEWREIEQRLPTPYLCFKLTLKGESEFPRASEPLQRILKLVREGRTLETIIKLCFLGRVTVGKTVIRMLDEGWLLPFPSAELRTLAATHRLQNRYIDALNIYRRLLASADADAERGELQRLIAETTSALRRAKAEPEEGEAEGVVSHKDAARAFQSRQRRRRAAYVSMGVLLFLAAASGVFYLFRMVWPGKALAAYNNAVETSEQALARHRYEEALKIWVLFESSLPEDDQDTRQLVWEKLEQINHRYRAHVENLILEARLDAENGQFESAAGTCRRVLEDYPNSALRDQARRLLERAEARLAEEQRRKEMTHWEEQLSEGPKFESGRAYERAWRLYSLVAEAAPEDSAAKRLARQGLERLQLVKTRIREGYEGGLGLLREGKAEKAIEAFEAAQVDWPELEEAQKARERSVALRIRQTRLKEQLAAVRAAQDGGDTDRARGLLEGAAREFAEFEEAAAIRARLPAVDAQIRAAQELLTQAQTAEGVGRLPEAQKLYDTLLEQHRGYLAARQICLPMHLQSNPSGAKVSLNGKARGLTPLRLELPLDQPVTLRLERAGYEAREQIFTRVESEHIAFSLRLDRAAVRRIELGAPALAAPLARRGSLYVAAGPCLVALDEAGAQTLWRTRPLESGGTAPPPTGWGEAEEPALPAAAPNCLRAPPLLLDDARLLQVAPGGLLCEVQTRDGQTRTLGRLPARPLRAPLLGNSQPALGQLVLIACADGRIRAYDPGEFKAPRWEAQPDETPGAVGLLSHRLLPATAGRAASASRRGLLCGWDLVGAKKSWTLELGAELSALGRRAEPAAQEQESLTVLVTSAGGWRLVDLAAGKLLAKHDPRQPRERVWCASLGTQALYLLTHDGLLRAIPRGQLEQRELKPVWEKALEAPGLAPMLGKGMLFVATREGNLYAISAADGREYWRFRCGGRPTHLVVSGDYLYVTTAEGQLAVLEAQAGQ